MEKPRSVFPVRRNCLLSTVSLFAVTVTLAFALVNATPGVAQSQTQGAAAAAPEFKYEVASIKPTKYTSGNGVIRMGMSFTPDGLTAENMNLVQLVEKAYGIPRARITGGPEWFTSERYDIEAKMDETATQELKKLDTEQLKIVQQHMLQELLAERFKLTLHIDSKELPIYTLVIAKSGLRIQESKSDDPAKGAPASGGGPVSANGRGGAGTASVGSSDSSDTTSGRARLQSMSLKAAPISRLVVLLSLTVGRPVFDQTGLTGKYDCKLEWLPDDSETNGEPSGPTIFTAVEEQLGLKLESGKGPVPILIIDHVERASEN